MSVTFDGDRAKKRLWFANKLIRVLKMLGTLSKSSKLNGFYFKVWNIGGVFGGRITSPMGVVVMHTCLNGVSVMTADNWKGGFDSRKYFKILFKNISNGLIINFFDRVPSQDLEDAGFSTFLNLPLATESPYYNNVDGSLGPNTEFHEDSMPTPVAIPMLAGEAFWTNISGTLFIDEDEDGAPDTTYHAAQESSLTFYSSDGSGLGGRRTLAIESNGSFLSSAAKTIAFLPAKEVSAVIFQYVFYADVGNGRYAALTYTGSKDGFAHEYFTLNEFISNMPSGLQDAINNPGVGLVSSIQPGGNYAFSTGIDIMPTMLHVVDLTNTRPGTADSAEDDWFDSNPLEENWRLSFHFQKFGETVYSVSSDNFILLLDHMASGSTIDPSGSWSDAMYMMFQLLPRPNSNYHVPYDSVMFHAEDADIYVWTRKYNSTNLGNFGGDSFNAFKFSRTGLSVTTLQIPAVVENTPGVRPTITSAGGGIYLCVCEEIDTPLRVHEIHVGSPFIGWTEIPKAEGTDNLIHIRPIRVKSDDIVLLGIIEDENGLYYFAFLEYKESSGSWNRLGKIPAIRPTEYPVSGNPYPYPDNSNWSVALFGEGEYAKEMSQYLSPPYALPQMPIGPYDGYTGGMP